MELSRYLALGFLLLVTVASASAAAVPAAGGHSWWSDPGFWVQCVLAMIAGALLAVLIVPKTRKALGARLMANMSVAYQRQLAKEFQRKFPDLYARFSGFKFTGESQAALMGAMKKIPPQEGLKLQTEFMRLSDNFQARHPELQPFLDAMKSQDAKGQAKHLQAIFKMKEDQRAAISKDLLWAYDQLSGRFPKWVKMLEGTMKGPAPEARPEPKTPEPAGKK
jgi:hypothetical protein